MTLETGQETVLPSLSMPVPVSGFEDSGKSLRVALTHDGGQIGSASEVESNSRVNPWDQERNAQRSPFVSESH